MRNGDPWNFLWEIFNCKLRERVLVLTEFKKIRQVEGLTRRLFTDNYFDLYLWYRECTTEFIGFQLVYCICDEQMALTAELGKVPNVRRIESGDGELYGPTDLLDGKGIF